jgi:hypothetical protein
MLSTGISYVGYGDSHLNLGSFVKNMFWYAKVIIIDEKNKQKTK